ncbi:MAG: GAF domain-containing protein [Chloroflexi bacterium]|nr:GAF domain-containing protein [Chloroflexota bacterium]
MVAAVLGRIQAAGNRWVALQIGLQAIVDLTRARQGVLLSRSPNSAEINYSGFLAEQKRIAVETLGHQLALIVENLELSQMAQDRQTLVEMLATAKQIGQRLSANLNAEQVLAEFLESGRFLFDSEHSFILAVNRDTETLRLLDEYRPDVSNNCLPEVNLSDTMLGWVARTGEPLLVSEAGSDERYSHSLKAVLGFEIRQLMAVPLSVRGEVIGVIGIVNKNNGRFDELDLSLLQMLAPSAAIALENAHRFSWQQAEMAQKVELYSVASHALRSPMMNILTSVEWILETGVQKKSHRTRLEDIRSQIINLAKFAGAILDVSRIEMENLQMQLAPVALTPLIKKTLTAFERRFPAHHFEMRTTNDIPPAYADEAQLAIILDHLVENAVKYSPADSTVRLKMATSGNNVLISVCDQGSGILVDELEDIFDRYYRGRHQPAREHSLGLGLSLVVVHVLHLVCSRQR